MPKAIITLNSPEAIPAGDLLCGRIAKGAVFLPLEILRVSVERIFSYFFLWGIE